MDTNPENKDLENESPRETSKPANIVAAGFAVASVLTPKDVVPPVLNVDDSSIAPMQESIGKTSEEMYSTPGIEEVGPDQLVAPVENSSLNDAIAEKGGVIMGGYDYYVAPDSTLGVTDSKDPNVFYPDALPKGGFLNLGGVKVKVTYNSGYFPEVGLLNFPSQGGLPKVGEVLPYMWFLPSEAYGKAYRALPYAASLPGALESDVYIDGREAGASYVVMPMVTVGNSMSITPPETDVDENGKERVIGSTSEGFSIDSNNSLGSSTGYVTWVLAKMTNTSQEYLDLEVLGVIQNSSDGKGIYVEKENLPQDVIDRCGIK